MRITTIRPRTALVVAAACVALLASACMPLSPNGGSTAPVQVEIGGGRGTRAIDFPDPFIAKFGSQYYGYSTSSNGMNFQVITSTDSVHWTWVGDALLGPKPYTGPTATNASWAKLNGNTWAPGVVERPANDPSQRYVFYYTAESTVGASAGKMCIGRATGASPVGPFTDELSQPMLCTPERGGSIDPNPIVVGGQVYLLWQSYGVAPTEPTRIWSTPLSADGRSVAGASSLLTEVLYNSPEWPNIEAPTMMPAPGGGFLLFYSALQWWTADYRTFVQYCTSVTGGCSRLYANAVLMSRPGMAGPGSPTVFQDPSGNWMMGFQAWTPPYIGYPAVRDLRSTRSLHILPITFPGGGHNPKIG
jgi:hypothetical protein